MMIRPLAITLLFSAFLLTSCNDRLSAPIGVMQDEPVSVDGGSANRANVQLDMRVGDLRVSGGATKLLEGNFEYNVARWKPQVTSNQNGVHATVTVRQPEELGGFGFNDRMKNTWDLRLANKTLLDLSINCGVGESRLNLHELQLRSLDVKIGVGQVDVDLTGKPTRDYEVSIKGGVGQASIHLPEGVGIWATATGGIGSIDVTGLQKQGDHWQNDLYDKAKVNVRIDVKGGIGEIRLIG